MKKIIVKNRKEMNKKIKEMDTRGYGVVAMWKTHCEMTSVYGGGRMISIQIG